MAVLPTTSAGKPAQHPGRLRFVLVAYVQEGENVFGVALGQLQALTQKSQPHVENLLLRVLGRQGAFCYASGLVDKATMQLQQALELARRLDNKKELAFALNYLGEITRTRSKFTPAIRLFEESLSFSRETISANAYIR